jgi:hypothetical protein
MFDAVEAALCLLDEEAREVAELVENISAIIPTAMSVINDGNYALPSESVLIAAVVDVCKGKALSPVKKVCPHAVRRSLNLLSPKDKRTLVGLIANDLGGSAPAEKLIFRTVTLLQREIRRDALNSSIKLKSRGDEVHDFKDNQLYFLVEDDGREDVYLYTGSRNSQSEHRFINRAARWERWVKNGEVKIFDYIEVAEAISRVQRVFMTIELDHGKKFSYNAFMEMAYMRESLRAMIIISQFFCDALDDARLNGFLVERARGHLLSAV